MAKVCRCGKTPVTMIVLVLMTLFSTALPESVRCKAGSFSLGETASVTCYFHEDIGKSLHHIYVLFSPFDSRNEVTDTEVLVCFNKDGGSRSCNIASGYNWDNVISSTLTIEIPDVQTRFAGHYSCHLVPLGDLQIKPCDLHVEGHTYVWTDWKIFVIVISVGIIVILLLLFICIAVLYRRSKKGGKSGQSSGMQELKDIVQQQTKVYEETKLLLQEQINETERLERFRKRFPEKKESDIQTGSEKDDSDEDLIWFETAPTSEALETSLDSGSEDEDKGVMWEKKSRKEAKSRHFSGQEGLEMLEGEGEDDETHKIDLDIPI